MTLANNTLLCTSLRKLLNHLLKNEHLRNEERQKEVFLDYYITWVANMLIVIDKCQLVDCTWFCFELTRYLPTKNIFHSVFQKVHKNEKKTFYDILYMWLCYRLVNRELPRNFLVYPKQVDHPCYIIAKCLFKHKKTQSCARMCKATLQQCPSLLNNNFGTSQVIAFVRGGSSRRAAALPEKCKAKDSTKEPNSP